MLGMLRSLFGGSNDELLQALRQGALIIDVRTRAEYQGGHVAGSKNIPLNEVPAALEKHPKAKPIVFCCASGGRSGQATSFAASKGYTAVNGGPWTTVNKAVSDIQQGQ
jgi:phage shock protein E